MDDDLEVKARKEVERTDEIMESLEMIDERASTLLTVLESYHQDAKGFIESKKFLEALEAAFVCWAYVDAGLHLGVFKVPDEMREIFTIGAKDGKTDD
jgi:hypothetical protein